jgi:hypothetical protein
MHLTSRGTIAYARCDDIIVMVCGPRPWSDEEWSEYLVAARRLTDEGAGGGSLTYMGGVSPTASQRRVSVEAARGVDSTHLRYGVLTESAINRAVVNSTALIFKLRGVGELRAFKPSEHAAACAWLNERGHCDPTEVARLLNAGMRLVGYPEQMILRAFLEQSEVAPP